MTGGFFVYTSICTLSAHKLATHMPEGHRIHWLARSHLRDFAQRRLSTCSPQGRFAAGAELLDRRKLNRVEAHGKHLLYHWQGGHVLHVHLGLYGRFRHYATPVPAPRGEIRLRVTSRTCAFDLNGPNICELLTIQDVRRLHDRLGPDPLRADADPTQAWERIRRSRAAIGSLLLNQAVIAGAGNIYRADVLFATGIHPNRPGHALRREDFDAIWTTLKKFMQFGLRYNRIVNADPKRVGKPRSRMTRDEALLVYQREYCRQCNHAIQEWELAGRRIYACPQCQPK